MHLYRYIITVIDTWRGCKYKPLTSLYPYRGRSGSFKCGASLSRLILLSSRCVVIRGLSIIPGLQSFDVLKSLSANISVRAVYAAPLFAVKDYSKAAVLLYVEASPSTHLPESCVRCAVTRDHREKRGQDRSWSSIRWYLFLFGHLCANDRVCVVIRGL